MGWKTDPTAAPVTQGGWKSNPTTLPPRAKVFQPVEDYVETVGDAWRGAGDAFTQSYRDNAAKQKRQAGETFLQRLNPVTAVTDTLRDLKNSLGIVSSVVNVPVAATVGGAYDAMVAAPLARGETRLFGPATEAPKLSIDRAGVHLSKPRQLSPEESERQGRALSNLALMGFGAGGAKALAGVDAVLAETGPARGVLARGAKVSVEPRKAVAPRPAPTETAAMRYIDRVTAKTPLDQMLEAHPGLMGGEAVGQRGKAAIGLLARQGGATADRLNAAVSVRQIGRPDRMLDEFTKAAGVDPQAAAGDIQSVVAKGRIEAAPLYEQAHDFGPMDSVKLQDLMRRGSMKRAMANARELAREDGLDPDALGLTSVENMDQWAIATPPSPADVAALTTRGRATPPSRGKTLATFVADKGGIRDVGGELRAMDAQNWHKGRAYQKPIIGSGSADDMAVSAWDAGYFPDHTTRPSIKELHEALGQELRGKPVFARRADPAKMDSYLGREAGDEAAYRGHAGEPAISPESYGARPEPVSEPAWIHQPAAKTWDYVKRGLDDVVEEYRDPNTRKLKLDNRGRAVVKTLGELRQELRTINPKYGEALDRSGDYLSADQAFADASRDIFNASLTERQLVEKLSGMSDSSKSAYRGGIANKFYNLAQTGKLDPKILRTPIVRGKLKAALGDEAAGRLIEMASREGDMLAFERRYAPGVGSVTAEMQNALADQAAGGGAQMVNDMIVGLAKRQSPVDAVLSAVGRPLGKVWDTQIGPTRGMSEAARDVAGERLIEMSPQELADLIAKYRASGPHLSALDHVKRLSIPAAGASGGMPSNKRP